MIEEFSKLGRVAEAFNRQAGSFDRYEEANQTLLWMRAVVHSHMLKLIHSGQRLLDLSAGTGIDALFFARQGLHVHAIDISRGMLDQLQNKVSSYSLHRLISFEERSFTDLNGLPDHGFDHIFSNFGGLNCISDPEPVIRQFDGLLKPGGMATLVVMPPICPCEILLALKGNFGLAVRRFQKNGTDATIDGVRFKAYYFTPRRLVKGFVNKYKRLNLRGLACFTPPPYFDKFSYDFPRLYRGLTHCDGFFCDRWPFNSWADHFILTMQYRP